MAATTNQNDDDEPLPDSPDQRLPRYNNQHGRTTSRRNNTTTTMTSSSSAAPLPDPSALLLYQSPAHVTIPKPHETPILSLPMNVTTQWAQALDRIPWYERLRIPAHLAWAIDPHRCRHDDEVVAHGRNKTNSNHNNKKNNNNDKDYIQTNDNHAHNSEQDATKKSALEQQNQHLSGGALSDALVELESVDHSTTPGSAPKHAAATTESNSTSSTAESKLFQRARRYKQQHGRPHRQPTTAFPTQHAPDPPAHTMRMDSQTLASATPSQPTAASQPHHPEWDLPTAMSDLTLPTALHTMGVVVDKPTGVGVITHVLSPADEDDNNDDDEDMDQWLDSALKSHDQDEGGGDDEDDDDDDQDNKHNQGYNEEYENDKHHHQSPWAGAASPAAVVPTETKPVASSQTMMTGNKPRNDDNNNAKPPPPPKYSSPPGINLAAFAEDDEDNMEDWLDSQIS